MRKFARIESAVILMMLLFVFTLGFCVSSRAQAPADLSQIQIKTTKISNNFYTLEGSGGMIGILTGAGGVVMGDTQYAPLTDKLVAAVKHVSNSPIRWIVNHHEHPHRTGGDENVGALGRTQF